MTLVGSKKKSRINKETPFFFMLNSNLNDLNMYLERSMVRDLFIVNIDNNIIHITAESRRAAFHD